ncbi:4-(cytidine 5'-diphospho)-2-C-methyl-D-erythritol kinase [Xanthomonas campestris pv. badrii]|uniref:4-diphosphocytidyl-2-C-methyl-D-erythritol kinase n=1 Tax=Xanthomonas campestris pv. badrii TaxID=149696 RepID=A0A7Z2V8H2_XANCA|nr:4-(cytidine 5'-diphospho)-2-C-methyl-D-erythritol kinase [Xanthomonas campestris]MCC4602814.1 4-(cytidine 5'-diphospho)-2-C-methyl-D-erythritol kinase [Xanthomonas campestris pv. parthenii]QJD66828.1 4-(cytidine 5'-diphospho)-2-C-methyl-D-erythritol kinase [Xanthomonas campestris pv. badrii]
MGGLALMSVQEGWSVWPAPAKLNLFLQITGRRADGYHLLQTVFRLLAWGDTIHLRVRNDGRIRRIGDGLPGVAEDHDLVVRAARLLQSAAGSQAGAEIRVDKRIPAGGGFGGGSSDAATVLVALNALWGLGLPVDALAGLGLQLGADVPVFVRGHNAWAEGVGEQLTPVTLAEAAYVLVDPGVHVPTPALFQSQELTRDAAPAKIADFASGSLLDNAFEPVLRRREPAVEAAFQALSRIGTPRLTGSGSGCFVEFATRTAAEQALVQLPGSLRAWVVEGAARSPLLDALDALQV